MIALVLARRCMASCALLLLPAAVAGAQGGVAAPSTDAVRVDFVDAPLADVIRTMGRQLGWAVAVGPVGEQRVTFGTPRAVRLAELEHMLTAILQANGLLLQRDGAVATVVAAADGARLAAPRALQTYVVPLQFAQAEDLANTLGALYGARVAPGRAGSVGDRSLGRALDTFRDRERQTMVARDAAQPRGGGALLATAGDSGAGGLVGETVIVPDPPTNALVIRTAADNYPPLAETIKALDIRPPQVLLEVMVAEVTLGRGFEFGVDWSAASDSGRRSLSLGNPGDSGSVLGGLAGRLVSLGSIDVRALLRTVASQNTVNVLATPQILAANNREARILVGSKVPFIASQRLANDVAIDRAVQYQDVGTKLSIIPTINSDDYVSVEVLQEVSTLTASTIAAALSAPVISTREASTRAVLRNGQTVVIAGLIGTDESRAERGIPVLKDIPLLGALFKSQSVTRNRSELAIFVTPYVVRTDADADALREKVQQRMRDAAPPRPAP